MAGSLINARTLMVPFIVVLLPWFYGRLQVLPLFWRNAPDVLPRHSSFVGGKYEIKFADRVRSCEDVILLEGRGVAVMGCDPGRERYNTVMGIFEPGPVTSADLYVYDYKSASTPDADALRRIELRGWDEGKLDFHTLGMGLDEKTNTLFVANHRQAGPTVEVFKLDVEAATADHVQTIEDSLIHGPNSIAVVNDKEFYVTNDHLFLMKHARLLAMLETYLAPPTGTVVHVKIESKDAVRTNVVARLPYANGIEFYNSSTIAVASTNSGEVYLYNVTSRDAEGKAPRLGYTGTKIRVPFYPDNLSRTARGSILVAGHPHIITTQKYAATRYICNDPGELAKADAEMQEYCQEHAEATSWVSEWTPEDGGLKHLYSGTEYPSSATAARDDGRQVGIVAGLYAKGIMVWRED